MIKINIRLSSALAALCFAVGMGATPDAALAVEGSIDIAQQPLFTVTGQPPLNMLVMGKDHKIYYEAYNDASDLNGDGALDIGYKPATIDYYGYFNSNACYNWSTDKFVPVSAATNKQCSGSWSGDFLNYLTTSRMDALRRVLYGGWRQVDSATETVLQGAFFPQDAHSWGKEYQSIERDGYDISKYAPLSAPAEGTYHLFAVTTVTGNNNAYPGYQAPLFRVLQNSVHRIWNWVSIEGPVAGNKCVSQSGPDCEAPAGTQPYPGTPGTKAALDSLESMYAIDAYRFGSGDLRSQFGGNGINCNDNPLCNPYHSQQDQYLSVITGEIVVPSSDRGTYTFAIDGDDAVDFEINGNGVSARVEWLGDHGSCNCTTHTSPEVTLGNNRNSQTYSIKFRHVENGGGAMYRLRWKKGTGGWSDVPFSNNSGTNLGLKRNTQLAVYDLTPTTITTSRKDYSVRVQSCPSGASNAALREVTCKAYPNGQYKPTGILHDYGETARMYFGLITGSQFNNLEGGVLRRNVSNFSEEINADTGQFKTGVDGIANSISRLRMIGGGYSGGTIDNLNNNKNWGWNNGTGNCPSVGDRAIDNGECRMWGNPLAEMLYESMRYFAGAETPTRRFSTGGASQGTNEETTMGLKQAKWQDPYASKDNDPPGGGFLSCARPFQTIISDINPSYDGDLPGSAFADAIKTVNDTPSTVAGFNASAQGDAIWVEEFGAGERSVFIGDANAGTDGAPTAKKVSSFGNIRGLSPEEPTKGGTYYSASVARYARLTDLNKAPGRQFLSTYAIALASPLPKIEFPVGDGKITLLPFAKTASGTFGEGTRKPTNTIVDFYVEKIVNLPGQPLDSTINEGRPYAVFRINYEDVEQGNDHDMDAIVLYEISGNANGTVTVTLKSEYAAGSADQNMGYVMSGTTQDGVYLDVRDTDSSAGSYKPYALNTPNPLLPGDCGRTTPPERCKTQLPLTSTRIFTPTAGTDSSTILLKDPLWYAAKYGAPKPEANDLDGDGVPDNYFLVTNPATLRTQLDKAFADIIAQSRPTASVATSSPRYTPGATLAYEASYNSEDWSGDIKAYKLSADATYGGQDAKWSASQRMPTFGARNIFTAKPKATPLDGFVGTAFSADGMDQSLRQRLLAGTDYDVGELIDFLRGDQSNEQGGTSCTTAADCPFRKRGSRFGDVLNSTPAVVGVTSLGYAQLPADVAGAGAVQSYAQFVQDKKSVYGPQSEQPMLYVGANDGMLHAINGSDGAQGGTELFAYVPNAVLGNLHELASPGYMHRYFVDGSPTVSDAYITGGWKTVLLGSTGAGARAVYALDITKPDAFSANNVLWEFNSTLDPDMGQFVGRPYMGLTDDKNWIAAFGNGYNSKDNRAVLFVRNLATGDSIAKLRVCANGTPENCNDPANGLATAFIVDSDGNGAGDTIYAGDYLGNMWRFELDGNAWKVGNGGVPLFTAKDPDGKPQSITSGVYTVANPLGGNMVIFGTGRYLNTNDADSASIGKGSRPAVDTIYGIWDSRMWDEDNGRWVDSQLIGTRTDLVEQTITGYTRMDDDGRDGYRTATRNPVDFRMPGFDAGKMGWYLDLSYAPNGALPGSSGDLLAGERVTATPQGILSDVVFNTFRPEGDSCEPGSQNATMVLDALTGAASYIPINNEFGGSNSLPRVGTDTGKGPPPGEPPILIIRPGIGGVPPLPCNPLDPDCVVEEIDPDAEPAVTSCSWRSPNPAGRPPGKLLPCGRISWKQLR